MRRGFTMIEICIVLALITIVLGPLFLQEQKMRASAQVLVDLRAAHEDARQAMLCVERDLAAAGLVVAPSLDGYKRGDLTCQLDGTRLVRNGVSVTRLVNVNDFVVYRDGPWWVATLAVSAPQGQWTLVSRVHVAKDTR